ncbi:MAG TPA: hypothetical protein VHA80_01885 [Solirubrobacterales bacterium]|nr:hypothetical protein [Solirubrobacterales bacterium]
MATTRKKAKPKAAGKTKAPAKAKAEAAGKAARKPKAAVAEEVAGKAAEVAEGTPLGPGVNAVLAGRAALAGTHAAGRAAKVAAARAKVPLVAGGGVLAGVAGGLAVVRRRGARSAQVSFDVDRVIAAARRAGTFGEELSRMASLMEQASSGSKRK